MLRAITSTAFLILGALPALAQGAYSCDVLLSRGLREYNISADSSSYLNSTFSQYCRSDGRVNSSSMNVGIDAVVKAIPIKFTLGSSDASQAMTNFCKTYSSSTDIRNASNSYQETIVRRAYDSYDACVRISSLGYYVTHDILTEEKAQVLLRAGVGKPIEVTGLDTSGNISCFGPDGAGNQVDYKPSTDIKSDNTIGIFCNRKSRPGLGGVTVFDEGSVAIAIAGDKYNFYWPKSNILPENLASSVQASISELRTNLEKVEDRLNSTSLAVKTKSVPVNPAGSAEGELACDDPGNGKNVRGISGGIYLNEPNESNASLLRGYAYPTDLSGTKWHYIIENAAGTGMGHPPGQFAAYVVCLTSK